MGSRNSAVVPPLRFVLELGSVDGLTDGQLLDRFGTRGDDLAELAFAALVERHGPMVLRVCTKILGNSHDAQDAFQATFVILARKARSIRGRDSIAGWLFGVSSRVATCARFSVARRRAQETRYGEFLARRGDSPGDDDLVARLHQEIARLPERFRLPIVLCDLEGLTHEQAAHRLGCPSGTVKSRLARGRARLGDRMKRPESAGIASGMSTALPGAGLFVTPALIRATTSRAVAAAGVRALGAGSDSVPVLSLAQGVIRMMKADAIRRGAIAASLAATLIGGGIAAAEMLADSPADGQAAAPPTVNPPIPVKPGEVTYEVTFLESPGLLWRRFGHTHDFELAPHTGISFLSPLEAKLVIQSIQSLAGSHITRAPKVTASPGGTATIAQTDDRSRASASVDVRPFVGRVEVPAQPFPAPPEGCSVRLRGEVSSDGTYVAVNFAIEDLHRVETHVGVGPDGRRVEVPELVRKVIDKKVTIPTGGIFLVGLGISRTAEPNGPARIAEQFVMIRAAKAEPPGAVASARVEGLGP